MNGIDPILIYLAGPMDDVSEEVSRKWRATAGASVPTGVALFSPAHAYFNVNTSNAQAVDHTNRHAIAASHGVLANLSGPGRGFGTIREIEFATRCGLPVVVIGDIESLLTYDVTVVKADDGETESYLIYKGIDTLVALVNERRKDSTPGGVMGILLGKPPRDEDE